MRAVLLMLAVPAMAHALSVVPISHEDAARTADGIVRGTVIAADVLPGLAALPVTRLTLSVVERLKGPPGTTVVLEFVGGDVDGDVHEVAGLRIPALGDDLVVFYRQDRSAALSNVVGVNQWYFWTMPDPERFGETMLQTADGLVVVGVSDGRIHARRRRAEAVAPGAGEDHPSRRQAPPAALIDADGREHPVADAQHTAGPPLSMSWATFRSVTADALRRDGAAR